MKADGNLVLASAGGTTYWETDTAGNPGALVVLQDDGDLVVYDTSNKRLWASNAKPNFSSPAIEYLDANGYGYVETSEWLKRTASVLPCSLALQWPDYATTIIEDKINGYDVVIQLWKGFCPQFFHNFPGGIGAEVGIYQRAVGRPNRPTGFPPPSTTALAAALAIGSIVNAADEIMWWPFPELNAKMEYTLTNPVTGQTFFGAGPETSYWLAKWMNPDSYAKYQRDQGPRYPGLPSWFPGNSNTPLFSVGYSLSYTINGKSYTSW